MPTTADKNNDTKKPPRDYRARLLWMYLEYCPDRVLNADVVLFSYKGREEQMMRDLVRHLGPEPDVAKRRERLVSFYKYYCPEKLSMTDDILSAYAGEINNLFEILVGKYGPEPTVKVETGHTNQKGEEKKDSTSRKNGLEKDVFIIATRNRLEEFYQYYAPEKLEAVDDIVSLYTRDGHGHQQLQGKRRLACRRLRGARGWFFIRTCAANLRHCSVPRFKSVFESKSWHLGSSTRVFWESSNFHFSKTNPNASHVAQFHKKKSILKNS